MSRGLSLRTASAAYAPFTPSNSEQRSPPPSYRGCWHGVSRGFLHRYRHPLRLFTAGPSSLLTELYTPKGVLTHTALLRQASAHCAKFPTAASRRSLGRVSVPVWLIILSDQRPIDALVGHYPTNQLIGRTPLSRHQHVTEANFPPPCPQNGAYAVLSLLSKDYPPSRVRSGTRSSPVCHATESPKAPFAFDLHVLSTPPAFVLSQDQTLHLLILREDLAISRLVLILFACVEPALLFVSKNGCSF